jgi:hypothetical protein
LVGKTWLSVIDGLIHASVHIPMSGLVLFKRFFSLHCFDFIDWQLMFNIFKGSDFALALVLLFLIGVEA